jgi:hypothetical protein
MTQKYFALYYYVNICLKTFPQIMSCLKNLPEKSKSLYNV